MKHEINPMQPHEFEPITIAITLENMGELKSLWARMILPRDYDVVSPALKGAYMDTFDLWKELDAILKARSGQNA